MPRHSLSCFPFCLKEFKASENRYFWPSTNNAVSCSLSLFLTKSVAFVLDFRFWLAISMAACTYYVHNRYQSPYLHRCFLQGQCLATNESFGKSILLEPRFWSAVDKGENRPLLQGLEDKFESGFFRVRTFVELLWEPCK